MLFFRSIWKKDSSFLVLYTYCKIWYDNHIACFFFNLFFFSFMKWKLKQWWTWIPPISIKRTIISHLNWTHWTLKDHDRPKHVTRLNRLMGCQPSPLDNWITNGNAYIRTCIYSRPFKTTRYYHTNEWQHKHEQYNSRVKTSCWNWQWETLNN